MDERNPPPPPPPGERVERHEVIERDPVREPPRAATPMWVWVLPLVLVVIGLVWFILSRGEPRSPLDRPDAGPEVTVPQPRLEVPTVEIPRVEPAPAPPAAPPAGPASPPQTDEAPAAAPQTDP